MDTISNSMRDVRVTQRQSIRAPFVAPDMAPVATIALELEKGLPDWTSGDAPEAVNRDYTAEAALARAAEAETFTCGDMIRKAPATGGPRVRRPRPTTRRWK